MASDINSNICANKEIIRALSKHRHMLLRFLLGYNAPLHMHIICILNLNGCYKETTVVSIQDETGELQCVGVAAQ